MFYDWKMRDGNGFLLGFDFFIRWINFHSEHGWCAVPIFSTMI